jgi:hypothetical protein
MESVALETTDLRFWGAKKNFPRLSGTIVSGARASIASNHFLGATGPKWYLLQVPRNKDE